MNPQDVVITPTAKEKEAAQVAKVKPVRDFLEAHPDLITSGHVGSMGALIPGGVRVRDVLMAVVGDAIQAANRKNADHEEALAKAKATLERVEHELKDFE